MIYFFSKFLKACGMALNPDKCHFTSVNCRLPPTIVIPDSKGSPVLVKWRDPSVPLKYLGYWLVPKNHGTKVSEVWRVHNEMVWDKLQNALARFQNSRLRANQVVRIFNSDILSILPYFFHSNHMQVVGKQAGAVSINSIKNSIFRTLVKVLHLMPNHTRDAIFKSGQPSPRQHPVFSVSKRRAGSRFIFV